MKYIVLLFWSAVLFTLLNYVTSAIGNTPFSMEQVKQGLIFSVVFAVFVVIVGAILPKGEAQDIDSHRQ
ncbi:DUF2929 family protein [Kurthia gibsonii]|uniref:DUF2929 family protein n=1 Tax=Kurthia gibsonii TaxID=33946 RepID=UPI0030D1C81A